MPAQLPEVSGSGRSGNPAAPAAVNGTVERERESASKTSGLVQATEQLRGVERYLGSMTEKNAQLSEINRSLKTRLDNSNRLLEEARTVNLYLSWQLERGKKRSWEESQQTEGEMTALKATRDYYKGRLDMCQLELKRLKRQAPPEVGDPIAEPVTKVSERHLVPTTADNQVKAAPEKEKGKESNVRPRNIREASIASGRLNVEVFTVVGNDDLLENQSLSRVLAFETLPFGKP
ncbi:hypothetical protein QFC20_006532 [Naganishia adeliensis]|uniref:Uncharacterized protein n=1 Tax=Naganishia adeliensis TaxID=92952 RepID=A0ACC2VA18_9TREE|nr:hypothetical protein QFC20_006532 [Naganishia adeliensis]